MVEGRLSGADTRTKITIERLRRGIGEYILNEAFQENIERSEVLCPPLAQWGRPPLPNPDRLRLCAEIQYDSLLACVMDQFAQVQGSLPPRQFPAPESIGAAS